MRSGHSGPTNAKQEIFSKLQYLNELVQSYECLSTISPDSEYYDGIRLQLLQGQAGPLRKLRIVGWPAFQQHGRNIF